LLLASGVAVLAAGLSGCSVQDIPNMLEAPVPATQQAERMHSLWQGSWVAALVVGVVTWGLIIYAIVAFRKRADSPSAPLQTKYNLPIEIMYTVIPLFVVGALFFFTQRDASAIEDNTRTPAHTVQVVGFQWNWVFNYLDSDVHEVGSPQQLPTLYLVQGETVRFKLDSPDVIHSFWVPNFWYKKDVIPGRTNEFEIDPTKLGTFAGRCAELCGVNHSGMLFWVKVVTADEYAQHMQDLRNAGQTGLNTSGRVSTNATGDVQGRTQIGGSS
jgi:cytochrome c oxidase subunit 2